MGALYSRSQRRPRSWSLPANVASSLAPPLSTQRQVLAERSLQGLRTNLAAGQEEGILAVPGGRRVSGPSQDATLRLGERCVLLSHHLSRASRCAAHHR